jgi:hypothetical protein
VSGNNLEQSAYLHHSIFFNVITTGDAYLAIAEQPRAAFLFLSHGCRFSQTGGF